MYGTERAVAVRQQSRTPTSAYACDAATGMAYAIISGQMVSDLTSDWMFQRVRVQRVDPWTFLLPFSRKYAEEAYVGAGLDLWQPTLPDHQYLSLLVSVAGEASRHGSPQKVWVVQAEHMLSPPGGPGAETCCTYHTIYKGNVMDWQGQSPYCARMDDRSAGQPWLARLFKCTRCHTPQEALN